MCLNNTSILTTFCIQSCEFIFIYDILTIIGGVGMENIAEKLNLVIEYIEKNIVEAKNDNCCKGNYPR